MYALLLVAELVCLMTSADGAVPSNTNLAAVDTWDETNNSLRFVYGFFRHGIRSPLYTPYPNDANKSKYHKYFPGPPGMLTKVGKRKMYDVGKHLKCRYGKFVGDYTEEKVYTSSTNMTRTVMSALSVMAGLFPPEEEIFTDLRWQPIPVWSTTKNLDKAYIYNDSEFPKLSSKVCPRYGKLIKEGYKKVTKPDPTKERKVLYELLQSNTGKSDVCSVDTLYQIWDTLQFESLNGLPLPSWATKPQPDYQNKPLYPDVMQSVMVEWFLETEYLNNNRNMLQFYTGPLFYSIQGTFKEKSTNPHSPEKMRFHATHDTTLFVFLWALQLKKPATVGPGDGILFELHEENNTHTVKIFYYDTNNNHTVTELISPLCPKPCDLNQFTQAIPGLSLQQWHEKCHSSQ